MNLTGFDPNLVDSTISSINSAYGDLVQALGSDMKAQFVDDMATKWACKNAQDFFDNSFKPAVDGLLSDSYKTFDSAVTSINSAGQAWAAETGTSYAGGSFSGEMQTIDVSSILENVNGVRGIDVENTGNTLGKLTTIAGSAKTALENAKSAVTNFQSFRGGNQQQNLIDAMETIKSNIDTAVENLNGQVNTAINQTVAQYEDTKGAVEQAFTAS